LKASYRETSPPFLKWQANGRLFDIDSLDLAAGNEVASAPRCAAVFPQELAAQPENRRLG
jgi:hypothetical protein